MEVRMRSLMRSFTICIILISLVIFPSTVRPLFSDASVTLSWNQNDEEDLSGYRVYYGLTSGQYDFIEEASSDTFLTLSSLENVRYYFAVTAYDLAGNESDYSEEISWAPEPVEIGDDIANSPGIPRSFNLSQNFPNPFNPSTTIRYSISEERGNESVRAVLKVYSLRGQEVKTLVDEERSPGEYMAHWNGENSDGVRMASGTYLYHLQAGVYSSTRKMVLGK
jgi:hypothetical protein